MKWTDSVSIVRGVGTKTEHLLGKLSVVTVGDLLKHIPRTYDIYEPVCLISMLREGNVAAVEGVLMQEPRVTAGKHTTVITTKLKDRSGVMEVVWFGMPFLKKSLRFGTKYLLRGEITSKQGALVMYQPEILSREEFYQKLFVPQPCYALTAGITNNGFRKFVRQVLEELVFSEDPMPDDIRQQQQLMDIKTSFWSIHFPNNLEQVRKARKRLAFDEFFSFALSMQLLKNGRHREENRHRIVFSETCMEFIKHLPFPLTCAQKRVLAEIQTDLAGADTMNRLIQGDVGSGKTVLAEIALVACALQGYQGCLMAPTEVLAKQHFDDISRDVSAYGLRTVLCTGSMTAKEKKEAYARIANHQADIILGTHALLQEPIVYDRLGLVVTDEQHRFGVRQRETLAKKGEMPHILVMSATPIPRTLALILYGDLDISVVDELPANRLPVKNCVVDTRYRPAAYRLMEQQVRLCHQVYIICPMVEEKETMEAENVLAYTQQLRDMMPPDVEVAYLHGQMKPKEKQDVMDRFFAGTIHILVSTTVIEVGINVPNATVMMVENAERFGLAQLHQLRGRVGRGQAQSYCIFMSSTKKQNVLERLRILERSNDGFVVAREDLKLRGPGDLFGIRQSGMMEFQFGDIYQDAGLLQQADAAAKNVWERYGNCIWDRFPQFKKMMEKDTRRISL